MALQVARVGMWQVGGSVRWLGWWLSRERLGVSVVEALELLVTGSRSKEEKIRFVSEITRKNTKGS